MERTADDQRTFRMFKSALTRAVNLARKEPSVPHYQRIVDLAASFDVYYSAPGRVFPDDWARWRRAGDDATYALARIRGTW
jgi:hypothetical protein